MARSRRERIPTPIPITYSVDEDALAERRQEIAAEVAANLYETLNSQLMRAQHELSELRIAYELLAEENEALRREREETKSRLLPDALGVYRRMVEADAKIDRPPPDLITQFCNGCGTELITADEFARPGLCENCDENGRPDLTEWVDVVEPSKNGTQ